MHEIVIGQPNWCFVYDNNGETTKGVQFCQGHSDQSLKIKLVGVELTMRVKIYHNPRCSKSRQTLAILQGRGIEPEIIEYLIHPPSNAQLEKILALLSMEPRDLMRKKEPEYRDNHLDDPGLTREQLIDAMVQHPKIIERPIVINNDKAALGRPPENVVEILND